MAVEVSSAVGPTHCRCLATKHECFSNCTSCGMIFCVQDESDVRAHGCFACSSSGASMVQGPMSAAQVRQSSSDVSEATVRAYELKDKLLQFDLETAKRTHVFDAQADYYETSVWLTEEEKQAIDEKQRKRREQLLPSSRRAYLTVNLSGGTATAFASFKKNPQGERDGEEDSTTMSCSDNVEGQQEDARTHVNSSLLVAENRTGGVYRLLLEKRSHTQAGLSYIKQQQQQHQTLS